MPFAALKPCSYPGCQSLVSHGYCESHKQPEISYHDPRSQRLYGTKRWQRIRRMQLVKQSFCEECLRANIYEPATDVDHVIPHRGDEKLFWSSPLQSLCKICHSRKTAGEVFGKNK